MRNPVTVARSMPDAATFARSRVAIGAAAPGGGAYATISTRTGVFVLGQNAIDEITQPHLDRNLVEIDRDQVQRIEITRTAAAGSAAHLTIRRDGDVWRTDTNAPVERTRVTTLLDRLTLVRAPRAFAEMQPAVRPFDY